MADATDNTLTSRLKEIENDLLTNIAIPVNCAERETGKLQDSYSATEINDALPAVPTLRCFVGEKIKALADREFEVEEALRKLPPVTVGNIREK